MSSEQNTESISENLSDIETNNSSQPNAADPSETDDGAHVDASMNMPPNEQHQLGINEEHAAESVFASDETDEVLSIELPSNEQNPTQVIVSVLLWIRNRMKQNYIDFVFRSLQSVSVGQQLVDAGTECAICLFPLMLEEMCKKLACLHMFHSNCILKWIEIKTNCPICRSTIVLDSPPEANGPNGDDGDDLDNYD